MEDGRLPGDGANVREQVEGFCEVCARSGKPRGGIGEPYDTAVGMGQKEDQARHGGKKPARSKTKGVQRYT
jgi:hypothetical protein